MVSFNYGGKKTKDVGFTCGCHLSNIMPDSIFYDSKKRWITQFFCLNGGNHCPPQHRRNGFSLITITPMGMGKP